MKRSIREMQKFQVLHGVPGCSHKVEVCTGGGPQSPTTNSGLWWCRVSRITRILFSVWGLSGIRVSGLGV